MNNKILSIAYGSNLNLPMMHERCPTAFILCQGKVENYEILFRGKGDVGGLSEVMATIEPCEGSSVPVAVWDIQESDEVALDIYEEYPEYYRKQILDVVCGDKTVQATAYIINDGHFLGLPDEEYLNSIREGYESAGFDYSIIESAVERTKSLMSTAK